ncbi:MAG: hypothetical protein F6K19_03825 [Cyanothece sp. SIO1E1]|nr:hypothetical protein [Cyanothece sp. SIO1E1]
MLGTFQQSNLRIEIEASEAAIRDSLVCSDQFCQWLWPQKFSKNLPDQLTTGCRFISWLGPIPIQHQVDRADSNSLRLVMSQSVDGFHEWHWGEGWLQSHLEGVSVLPLNLAQTLNLLRLRQFLAAQSQHED